MYLTGRPLFLFGMLFMLLGIQLFAIGFLGEMFNQNRFRTQGDPVNIRATTGFGNVQEKHAQQTEKGGKQHE